MKPSMAFYFFKSELIISKNSILFMMIFPHYDIITLMFLSLSSHNIKINLNSEMKNMLIIEKLCSLMCMNEWIVQTYEYHLNQVNISGGKEEYYIKRKNTSNFNSVFFFFFFRHFSRKLSSFSFVIQVVLFLLATNPNNSRDYSI